MEKSYPSSGIANVTGEAYEDWPYAVKVSQVSNAGSGTPTCLGPQGQSLGDFSVADKSEECECAYLNTGT